MSILSCSQVSFYFDNLSKPFFSDISFEITLPGIYFVAGRNGIGKSTFCRIIMNKLNLQERLTGTLLIYDHKPQRSYVGFVHQKYDDMLVAQLTGLEHLQLASLSIYPGFQYLPAAKNKDIAESLGIPLDIPVKQLSGGQRQMLAFLMVLKPEIKILILDEPTAALDDINAQALMGMIRFLVLSHGITVFCITHDEELRKKYADGIISLECDMYGDRQVIFKEFTKS